ncbi:MAG: helix-turn-helix transcriptional regulator [Bacteriovoracaceae bacterium]|nr:helix-turn-helix transcriptional regulator [Bacteriovoracaceae bacterium]
MKYQFLHLLNSTLIKKGLSQRHLEKIGPLSRTAIRRILNAQENVTLKSIDEFAQMLDLQTSTIIHPAMDANSDFSIIATSWKIQKDGFSSWKIHLMDFVDEFRASVDPRLILLPPTKQIGPRLFSLLSSTVYQLCCMTNSPAPDWCMKKYTLDKPWFVAGVESLKAYALLESPLPFRQNNIFVLNNFLERI